MYHSVLAVGKKFFNGQHGGNAIMTKSRSRRQSPDRAAMEAQDREWNRTLEGEEFVPLSEVA